MENNRDRSRLKKAEMRVVIWYASDAGGFLHALKSTDRLGSAKDFSLLIAVPEAEEVRIYPLEGEQTVLFGEQEKKMSVPVGGYIVINHGDAPDEEKPPENLDPRELV